MIHIKNLSGEVVEVYTEEPITVEELRSRFAHPFPVFFRGERQLEPTELVNSLDTLSVVFQSYRTYFVWCGCENSVWPGERDKIFCYDFSARDVIEWKPELITDNDAVVVDYLSFGLYQNYNDQIKDILQISFLPIDLDFQAVKDCFHWKPRAKQDHRRLGFLDFIGDYADVIQWTKYVWIFRVNDGKERTPLEWISRITE